MPKTIEKNYIEQEKLEMEMMELLNNAFVELDKGSGTCVVSSDLKEQILECIRRQPKYA